MMPRRLVILAVVIMFSRIPFSKAAEPVLPKLVVSENKHFLTTHNNVVLKGL